MWLVSLDVRLAKAEVWQHLPYGKTKKAEGLNLRKSIQLAFS